MLATVASTAGPRAAESGVAGTKLGVAYPEEETCCCAPEALPAMVANALLLKPNGKGGARLYGPAESLVPLPTA